MGHYLSEMGDRPEHVRGEFFGYDHKDLINSFMGGGMPSSCPVCGASIKWDWYNAKNLIIHIRWHESIA